MAKRIAVLLLVVVGAFVWSSPVSARHNDRHCSITVHVSLGTDDLVGDDWPEDVPSDLGSVKVFVNCTRP